MKKKEQGSTQDILSNEEFIQTSSSPYIFISHDTRDAFSQDLTWNLDESKIITYRTIKAEVIKATNSKLEIKVLEDGGLDWLP